MFKRLRLAAAVGLLAVSATPAFAQGTLPKQATGQATHLGFLVGGTHHHHSPRSMALNVMAQ